MKLVKSSIGVLDQQRLRRAEEQGRSPRSVDGEVHVLAPRLGGYALLNRLAVELRARCGGRNSADEPFLFAVTSGSRPRLQIDAVASVECDREPRRFRVTLKPEWETSIAVDTTSFEAVIEFVGQYVAEKLAACSGVSR